MRTPRMVGQIKAQMIKLLNDPLYRNVDASATVDLIEELIDAKLDEFEGEMREKYG